ncbi:MAG: FecR domain-containing protein [Pseudomonadota bacterium]
MTDNRNNVTDPLTRDASRWVTQLVSGEATAADAEALAQWRQQSPAHEAAFAEAVQVWRKLKPGGYAFIERRGFPVWSGRRQQMTRRAVLAGGALAAASAAVYATVDPPFGLWPSFDELKADYRTATGEQRRVNVADVAVQMNTQTSIAIPKDGSGTHRIRLIAGEASFTVPSQSRLTVLAGPGRMLASGGRFDVRALDSKVCVTCLEGQIRVEVDSLSVPLNAGSQLTYDRTGIGQSAAIDTADTTAWQDGFIIFRGTPLSVAVAEINRYRPGRVILLNAALAATPLSGRFRIDRVEDIIGWIAEITGARSRSWPGGIVLLS